MLKRLAVLLSLVLLFALLASFAAATPSPRACARSRGHARGCQSTVIPAPLPTATPRYSRIITTPRCIQVVGVDCP